MKLFRKLTQSHKMKPKLKTNNKETHQTHPHTSHTLTPTHTSHPLTMLLLHVEEQSLCLQLLKLASHHVGGFPGIVLNQAVGPCLNEDLDELLGAVLGCMMESSVAGIIL